jgi:hypothetical protein
VRYWDESNVGFGSRKPVQLVGKATKR